MFAGAAGEHVQHCIILRQHVCRVQCEPECEHGTGGLEVSELDVQRLPVVRAHLLQPLQVHRPAALGLPELRDELDQPPLYVLPNARVCHPHRESALLVLGVDQLDLLLLPLLVHLVERTTHSLHLPLLLLVHRQVLLNLLTSAHFPLPTA